ncbi:none [Leptomonas seymouri]|uniref:None n=1 Tax=Leptomonas seymouri TaxID=5684 RepID=A0A0N0P2Q5_LEPSE|nr:none [Leptomonas seymouri]|eukprot:KPI83229.1 none [Leptomonas seymouri]
MFWLYSDTCVMTLRRAGSHETRLRSGMQPCGTSYLRRCVAGVGFDVGAWAASLGALRTSPSHSPHFFLVVLHRPFGVYILAVWRRRALFFSIPLQTTSCCG